MAKIFLKELFKGMEIGISRTNFVLKIINNAKITTTLFFLMFTCLSYLSDFPCAYHSNSIISIAISAVGVVDM